MAKLKPYIDKIPQGAYRLFLEESLAKRLGLLSEQLTSLWANAEIIIENELHTKKTPKNLNIIERALALLLVHPDLSIKFTPPNLSDQDSADILNEVWQFCAQYQPAHFGVTLAHFKDAKFYELLAHLGAHPYVEMIQDIQSEFRDIMLKLEALTQEIHIEYLIAKSRQEILSPSEKTELQNLLKYPKD